MPMEYLPVSKINTVVFCERRFYYEYVMAVTAVNHHILEGRFLHDHVYTDSDQETGVWIFSDTLGLVGVVDKIDRDGEAYVPIEYKKGRLGDYQGDAVQLCAQALCLEEMRSIVIPHGYVYYHATRRRQKIVFEQPLREQVKRSIGRMHRLINAPHAPARTVPTSKCNGCSIHEECQPEIWRVR